jgi:hypothetical protein
MKKVLVLFVLMGLFSFGSLVRADLAGTRVPVLYVLNDDLVGTIGATVNIVDTVGSTVSTIDVPSSAIPAIHTLTNAILSDNERYLVITYRHLDGLSGESGAIIDLTTGVVSAPLGLPVAMEALSLGGFEPNGTRFSLGYISNPDPAFGAGGLLIMDATTNAYVYARPRETDSAWSYMGDWNQNGVQYTPNCYACGGVIEGNYWTLNAATSAVIASGGDYFHFAYSDTPLATSEILYQIYDPAYPTLAGAFDGMFSDSNVIKYGNRYTSASDPVVMSFSDPLVSSKPHWIADGQAFIIEEPASWMLVRRDGSVTYTGIANPARFITGTKQGWIGLQYFDSGITPGYYLTNNVYNTSTGGWLSTPLGGIIDASSFYEQLILLNKPILGGDISLPGITTWDGTVLAAPPFTPVVTSAPPIISLSVDPNLIFQLDPSVLQLFPTPQVFQIDPNVLQLINTPDPLVLQVLPSSTPIPLQIDPNVIQLLPSPTPLVLVNPNAFATPTFVPPPPNAITCPGFMQSRLVVGAKGIVLPGDSNNLRSQPTASSQKVGQIPGNGVFDVLEGPVCDNNAGIAWWRVRYNGIEGWTGEGQGFEYWTAPQ